MYLEKDTIVCDGCKHAARIMCMDGTSVKLDGHCGGLEGRTLRVQGVFRIVVCQPESDECVLNAPLPSTVPAGAMCEFSYLLDDISDMFDDVCKLSESNALTTFRADLSVRGFLSLINCHVRFANHVFQVESGGLLCIGPHPHAGPYMKTFTSVRWMGRYVTQHEHTVATDGALYMAQSLFTNDLHGAIRLDADRDSIVEMHDCLVRAHHNLSLDVDTHRSVFANNTFCFLDNFFCRRQPTSMRGNEFVDCTHNLSSSPGTGTLLLEAEGVASNKPSVYCAHDGVVVTCYDTTRPFDLLGTARVAEGYLAVLANVVFPPSLPPGTVCHPPVPCVTVTDDQGRAGLQCKHAPSLLSHLFSEGDSLRMLDGPDDAQGTLASVNAVHETVMQLDTPWTVPASVWLQKTEALTPGKTVSVLLGYKTTFDEHIFGTVSTKSDDSCGDGGSVHVHNVSDIGVAGHHCREEGAASCPLPPLATTTTTDCKFVDHSLDHLWQDDWAPAPGLGTITEVHEAFILAGAGNSCTFRPRPPYATYGQAKEYLYNLWQRHALKFHELTAEEQSILLRWKVISDAVFYAVCSTSMASLYNHIDASLCR